MKEIIILSYSSDKSQTEKKYEVWGKTFSVTQYGLNYDFKLAKEVVKKFDKDANAIALTGMPNPITINGKVYIHPYVRELKETAQVSPIDDGQLLREFYIPWQLNKMVTQNKWFFQNKRVGFFCGIIQFNYLDAYLGFAKEVLFADSYFLQGIPVLMKRKSHLENFIKLSFPVISKFGLSRYERRNFKADKLRKHSQMKAFLNCDMYVLNETQLPYIDTDILQDKIVIIDSVSESSRAQLNEAGVKEIISFNPSVNGEPINFTVLSAMLRAMKEENVELEFDEVLPYLEQLEMTQPKSLKNPDGKVKKKFAFLIHPLQKSDLLKVKFIENFKGIKGLADVAENLAIYAPGFIHGKILGIESPESNHEVEGYLYIVPMTPKMLLKTDPEKFYEKVREITEDAKSNGCEIFGLGAYTKIVGDAGVSIAKRSKIPVTTGNSLSSASTLWAANYAVEKMGFVPIKDEVFQGKVMVVGATGSIGKVTAKLVSQRWSEVVLVAPKPFKLMELKEEILKISPHANVIYATNPDKYSSEMDLIITTTSNQGEKVLDIEKVKSGAVICDVSRPFDISEDDARSRPDVLVIASGEVELPGPVKLTCNIGLHGSVVYACLAETALLTLENRFENFSLSRNLNYEKVREIDRIARKHGVKLAAIMGHKDEITPEEIELCRELALKKRAMNG